MPFPGRVLNFPIPSFYRGYFQSHRKECVTHISPWTHRKCPDTHTFWQGFLSPADNTSTHRSGLKEGRREAQKFPSGGVQVKYTACQVETEAKGQEEQRKGEDFWQEKELTTITWSGEDFTRSQKGKKQLGALASLLALESVPIWKEEKFWSPQTCIHTQLAYLIVRAQGKLVNPP